MTASETCPFALPPGPSPDPDELWQLEQDPSLLENYRDSYGGLFTLHRPGQPPRVFLGAAQHIRGILLRHDKELPGMGTNIYRDLIGPQSMLKLSGAEHRRLRRIVLPRFSGSTLVHHAEEIRQTIVEGLSAIRGQAPQPLAKMTIGITARVMTSTMVFPPLQDAVRSGIEASVLGVLDCLHEARTADGEAHRLLEMEYGRHRGALDCLILDEINRARRVGKKQSDSLLDGLLWELDAAPDQYIRDQIVSVLAGGVTTAANGMSMALYWLHHRPDTAARIDAELSTLPDVPSATEIAALPYLSAFCLEALRVPTVTPTGDARRVRAPFSEQGFHFAEGTEIIVALHLAHHDEDQFPDHNEFRPERFLGQAPDGMNYMPFGIGTHYCVGAQLAELEMKLTVAESMRLPEFAVLGAEAALKPRSHGVNLTIPHDIQAVLGQQTTPVSQEAHELAGLPKVADCKETG